MSINKKLLATAVAGLLVSGNAAAVVLQTGPALTYANELVAPFSVTTVGGSAEDLNDDIAFTLGYNFSGGEVRYGRLECSSNMTMSNPVISESSADITLGAINGAGTNALFFSITATNPVSGATSAVALNVDADLAFANKNNVNCEFSIYDQPSQAQAGGTTGRIYSTGSRPFATFADSVVFTTAGGRSVADVQAVPAYTHFVGGDNLFGQLTFGLTGATRLDKDGAQITMADIFAPTTSVTLAGSFDAATSVTWNGVAAAPLNSTLATWTGNTARTGEFAYNESGSAEIQASSYVASLNPVTNAGYTVSARSLNDAGTIVRNGTQLQAPLAQLPTGYLSRIALTNTGSVARAYTIRVIGETGNTITTNATNLTGSIPANGMKFFELNTVISGFSAGTRAAVIVTVDAPNEQIQGVYQIVNPANGSISNHVMVRPGTN